MIWGQGTEGSSKQHIRDNPKAGFLVRTLGKELWRGRARFTHTAQQGPEFEMYNTTPMFSYNADFGVHTVFLIDLVEHSGRQELPPRVLMAAVQSIVARLLSRERYAREVIIP